MPRSLHLLSLLCAFAVGPVFAAVDESPPTPDLEVLHADFGLFDPAPSGALILTPSDVVPLKAGQRYGWSIALRTSKPKVRWREEFVLPAAPTSWAGEGLPVGSQTVSPDRMTSVVEMDAPPIDGVIQNIWVVAPGDPKGHYIMRVTIDGGNQQVFEFDVQ